MVTTALDHGMTPGYRVLPVWERLPADTGTATWSESPSIPGIASSC